MQEAAAGLLRMRAPCLPENQPSPAACQAVILIGQAKALSTLQTNSGRKEAAICSPGTVLKTGEAVGSDGKMTRDAF